MGWKQKWGKSSGTDREQTMGAVDQGKDTGLYTLVTGRARKSRSELLENLFRVIREYWTAVKITEYRTGRKGRRKAISDAAAIAL